MAGYQTGGVKVEYMNVTLRALLLVTSDFSLIIPGSCYLLIVLSFAIAKYVVVSMFFKSHRLISETDQAAVVNTFWCQR